MLGLRLGCREFANSFAIGLKAIGKPSNVEIGKHEDLRCITGCILRENVAMRRVRQKIGFDLQFDDVDGDWQAELVL